MVQKGAARRNCVPPANTGHKHAREWTRGHVDTRANSTTAKWVFSQISFADRMLSILHVALPTCRGRGFCAHLLRVTACDPAVGSSYSDHPKGTWTSSLIMAFLALTTVAASGPGLTLTTFDNTAYDGPGRERIVTSLEKVQVALTPSSPHSALLSGALAPHAPGKYGFQLQFEPELPFPSPLAYARLWVDDHLVYPPNTTLNPSPEAASSAPLWIALPPRALHGDDVVDAPGAAPLSNYSIRLTYVCLAPAGCGARTLTLRWSSVAVSDRWPVGQAPFAPIPSSALLPLPSPPEQSRRALAARLQRGWGTFYNPSVLTWELLPEGFALSVGLYRLSTQALLEPRTLTIDPTKFHRYAVRAGLHSYNQSFAELSLAWRGDGGGLNVSIAATVLKEDESQLALSVTVEPGSAQNASDFAVVLIPAFVHGRAGTIDSVDAPKDAAASRDAAAAAGRYICGHGAGLRSRCVRVLEGSSVELPARAALPGAALAVSLATRNASFSTLASDDALTVRTRVAEYRSAEAALLTPYGEWASVKDSMQSRCAVSRACRQQPGRQPTT